MTCRKLTASRCLIDEVRPAEVGQLAAGAAPRHRHQSSFGNPPAPQSETTTFQSALPASRVKAFAYPIVGVQPRVAWRER